VIDGMSALKSVNIGKESFIMDNNRRGSKCVIMNCDQLSEINIGRNSFEYNQGFELKNLPLSYPFNWVVVHSVIVNP